MWRVLVLTGVASCFAAAVVGGDDSKPIGKPSAAAKEDASKTANTEKQEAAIRELVAAFVKAYNAHDSKALAELFLPEAQVIDEDDNTIQGRGDIEALFAGVFEQNPQSKIEVAIESIRFIGTMLAVETGSTTISAPGEVPERGRYSVLHVLRDGKWSMGLVRDMPAEPTHREHLQALCKLDPGFCSRAPCLS